MTRFRRTKDEVSRGLTPEQALKERQSRSIRYPLGIPREKDLELLERAGGVALSREAKASLRRGLREAKASKTTSGPASLSGEIVIRIRPEKGVDADYFEYLTSSEILISQDEHFYKWIDHLLDVVYSENHIKLFQDILDDGIGQVLTTRQKPKDI